MASIEAYSRPSTIYRLRPLTDEILEREIKAIAEKFVFCPNYKEMNDPMEGNHRESAMLKESRSYGRSITEVRDKLNGFGIASFSESKSHEPMWAYYASNFEGMCVAYSMKLLLTNLPKNCEFVKMTYNEQAPILLRNSEAASNRAKLILSCKSIKWAGEREWRLIRPDQGSAPYRKGECVTAVYLGSRINPDHRKAIVSAMSKADIRVFQMDIDSYDIEFKRIAPPKLSIKRKTSTSASK